MSWLDDLRAIFDSTFARDWDAHLASLNRRYDFEPVSEFKTVAPGLPPVWFNGDVEAISPRDWTLVISINPGSNPLSDEIYQQEFATPTASWEHWRTYNRTVRRTQSDFFARLADLASEALGHKVTPGERVEYSTSRMVFVEVCPYSTPKWPPKQRPGAAVRWNEKTETELFTHDPGVAICSEITRILIERAEPALVMVNGSPAVRHLERVQGGKINWHRREYESAAKPGKQLWHMEGQFASSPLLGFPQLRRMSTHNAAAEVAQLAASGRTLTGR